MTGRAAAAKARLLLAAVQAVAEFKGASGSASAR